MVTNMPCIPQGYDVKELPTLLGKNLKFLDTWAEQNEEQFSKVMEVLAREQPAKFADIYMKVAQTLVPKTSATFKKTEVNYHHIETDMAKIRSLAGMRVNPKEQIEAPGQQTEYKDYEEVKATDKQRIHPDILD